MSITKRILQTTFAFLFGWSLQANANVIYDVVVDYAGGYRYTFSMEFTTAPPPTVTEADLVSMSPDQDFFNERFFEQDGALEWTLTHDFSTSVLTYDGFAVLSFLSIDRFCDPLTFTVCTVSLGSDLVDTVTFPGIFSHFPVVSSAVTARSVSSPGSVTLILLGLLILWWRTRIPKRGRLSGILAQT